MVYHLGGLEIFRWAIYFSIPQPVKRDHRQFHDSRRQVSHIPRSNLLNKYANVADHILLCEDWKMIKRFLKSPKISISSLLFIHNIILSSLLIAERSIDEFGCYLQSKL